MQAEGHHKAHLSHELIAAAASYEVCNLLDYSQALYFNIFVIQAMKAYHHHCEKNGQPVSHAQAKEIL
jgi:hypothetical protein